MRQLGTLVAAAYLCTACDSLYAVTYFQKSWTGAQLLADSSVHFPGLVSTTLDGTTLRWGDVPDNLVPPQAYATRSPKFIEIPMVAGVLASNAQVRVTLDFELARSKALWPILTVFDNDPSGSDYLGGALRPVGASSVAVDQGTFSDHNHDNIEGYRDILDRASPVSPFEFNSAPPDILTGQLYWDYHVDRFGISFAGGTSFNWSGYTLFPSSFHNIARGLTFAMWLNPNDDQSGGVRSLSLRVEQVPEPSLAAVLLSGALAIPTARWRRRRAG